jgi:hypothetical protein
MEQQIESTSVLRIYPRQSDMNHSTRWWQRSVEAPLSHHLARAATEMGIGHAVVNLSDMSRTRKEAKDSHGHQRFPLSTLRGCVELLAPNPLLEQFMREQAKYLQSTTLIMLDGTHVSDLALADVERLIEKRIHSVERVRGADSETELSVEHVNIDELGAEEGQEQDEEEEEEQEGRRRRINAAACI